MESQHKLQKPYYLYKMDINLNIREWSIQVVGKLHESYVVIRYGLLNGKKAEEVITIKEANHYLKAINEGESKLNKQKNRRGYTEEIPTKQPFIPMKFKTWEHFNHCLPQEVVIQPKLNGHRGILSQGSLKTFNNDSITSLPHIIEASNYLDDDIILDGEMFSPKLSLQEISKLTRTHTPQPDHQSVQLHVFDCINLNLPFEERIKIVIDTVEALKKLVPNCPIKLVPSTIVHKDDVLRHYNSYLTHGYEGAIVRDPENMYQLGARVTSILKIKPFEIEPFRIVDIVDSDKRKREAILVFRAENGELFKASLVGNRDYRTQIYIRKDQFIGKLALVKYPNESDEGTPVQSVVTQIL